MSQLPSDAHNAGETPAAEPFSFTLPDAAETGRERQLWAGVILLLALIAYVPAIQGNFIWDDPRHVSENALLRSARGLKDIWVTSLQPGPHNAQHVTPQYYPLTHTTFWLEYRLWRLNPLGYHLVNVLLHAATAIGLWQVLRLLKIPGAWLAAAIFAVHPVHVESVAWISERKNVLSGFFFMVAAWCYLRFALPEQDDEPTGIVHTLRQRGWLYGLALLLFICAILSKTVASVLPVGLILVLWYKRRPLAGHILLVLPMLALGVAAGSLTAWIERNHVMANADLSDWSFSAIDRLLIAGNAIWFYVGKLLWPAKLSFVYARWEINSSNPALFIGPAAVVLALLALLISRRRGPLAAALFFIAALVPALGFVNVYPMLYSFVADHFVYLASIGLIVPLVAAVARKIPARADVPWIPLILSALLLTALTTTSWLRARVFVDEERLWRDTLAKNAVGWMPAYNLGRSLSEDADALEREAEVLEQGVKQYEAINRKQAAAELSKQAAETRATVDKKRAEAMELYRRTLSLRPQHDKAYVGMGYVLNAQNKTDEALAIYAKAIEVNPKGYYAHVAAGTVLANAARWQEAYEHFRQAAALRPESASLQMAAGRAAAALKQFNEAGKYYVTAISLDPELLDARYQFGIMLTEMARRPEYAGSALQLKRDAFEQFDIIIREDPRHADAHRELGFLFGEAGQFAPAAREFQLALQLNPQDTEALRGMELALKALTPATRPATTRTAS